MFLSEADISKSTQENSGKKECASWAFRPFTLDGTEPAVDSPWSIGHLFSRTGVEIRFREGREHLPEGGIVAQGPHSAGAIAAGYVFETDVADMVAGAFSNESAPLGYSYVLICRGRGTVASCMFTDFHDETRYLERTVEFFRSRIGLEMHRPRRFGGLGHFGLTGTARNGSILFAGESAGFQDALWGFGLRYAMLSGYVAAKSVLRGEPENYDRLWKARLGGYLRSSVVNRYVYERLGDRGYRSLLHRIDQADDARHWLRAQYAPSMWKSFLLPAKGAILQEDLRHLFSDCRTMDFQIELCVSQQAQGIDVGGADECPASVDDHGLRVDHRTFPPPDPHAIFQ